MGKKPQVEVTHWNTKIGPSKDMPLHTGTSVCADISAFLPFMAHNSGRPVNFWARDKTAHTPGEHMPNRYFFFFFFSFISLVADGPHHYHPARGHKGSFHLSPVHALQFFYRDASSALLQLVNQWLNFTYSRSHAFRYEERTQIILLW